jgi:acetate kinase
MDAHLLTLNAGSSSLKFALFRADAGLARVQSGTVNRLGQADAEFKVTHGTSPSAPSRPVDARNPEQALGLVLQEVLPLTGQAGLIAIGHRVVHGGPNYTTPQRVTPALLAELRRLSAFDPEHLPAEISLIQSLYARFPDIPQFACFDTAFHHDLPRIAQLLPLPRRYADAGVRRYGFHGLSFQFLMEELRRIDDPAATKGRVILAHLGSGASLAAVHRGHCVDTSMGFTPTAGLVMGTRTGDLDPGLVAYLARTEQMTAPQFQRLVNHQSGLLGVSGISSDMRELLSQEANDTRAAEAIELFCYQARKWIGAYAAVLGGIDTLVFAGGIGENCPGIRRRICAGLEFLGLDLDQSRNADNEARISLAYHRTVVRVIRTDEELTIARAVTHLLQSGPAPIPA